MAAYLNKNGWHSHTTDDYHGHVNRMLRMPSIYDAPSPAYPKVHSLFKNDHGYLIETQEETEKITTPQQIQCVRKEETVRFQTEEAQVEEEEEDIDSEAAGFIEEKRKRLLLCKWKSTKGP